MLTGILHTEYIGLIGTYVRAHAPREHPFVQKSCASNLYSWWSSSKCTMCTSRFPVTHDSWPSYYPLFYSRLLMFGHEDSSAGKKNGWTTYVSGPMSLHGSGQRHVGWPFSSTNKCIPLPCWQLGVRFKAGWLKAASEAADYARCPQESRTHPCSSHLPLIPEATSGERWEPWLLAFAHIGHLRCPVLPALGNLDLEQNWNIWVVSWLNHPGVHSAIWTNWYWHSWMNLKML